MSDRADRFTVILDTDVLVGALVRNIILSFAEAGLFRARWSSTTIHGELEPAIMRAANLAPEKAALQRERIEVAFPEAEIAEDPALVASLSLPDPDDRHIFAAAIQTKAALIVTNNLKDFPQEALGAHQIEPISADSFIADCIDLAGPEAIAVLRNLRERFKRPEMDAEGFLRLVEERGLSQTATMLQEYRPLL
ncbi:PIN domain-containing protein [Rhodobacter sp. 24-YEA-8]|uniref:PIN domain-containing protein n=1 Tax=Rhodobacter sp. 24-YEA-8 TaxID=1884310 RepID=UPI0008968B95|nr:PIN domain-containing protein [Rhodobacter sp. 24-YEA-8]SEB46736.1 PIN domain-containing protein [Rhodobacter sp. 24-YEA-8]